VRRSPCNYELSFSSRPKVIDVTEHAGQRHTNRICIDLSIHAIMSRRQFVSITDPYGPCYYETYL